MGKNREKLYWGKSFTYEELLEELKYNTCNLEFEYREKTYYLTDVSPKNKPCIIRRFEDCSPEQVLQYKDTFEELLENFKFDDGVVLLEALKEV